MGFQLEAFFYFLLIKRAGRVAALIPPQTTGAIAPKQAGRLWIAAGHPWNLPVSVQRVCVHAPVL